MTLSLAEYVKAGFELTPEDRMEAARLLQAADDEDVQLSTEWLDEIDARADDVISGKVRLVDSEKTFRRALAELAAR